MIKVSGTINGRQFKTQFIPFYRTCQFESRQLSGESMSMLCPVLSWFGPGPTAFFARALHRLILSIYFGSIVLSWTYQDLSNLATLLARKTTKDTSQIASTCRNQHQPTHTHIYIYPWIARNLLCYNFYQFFPPKSEQNIAVVFRFRAPGPWSSKCPTRRKEGATRQQMAHFSWRWEKPPFFVGYPLVNLDFAKWYRCPIWCSYTIWNADFPW